MQIVSKGFDFFTIFERRTVTLTFLQSSCPMRVKQLEQLLGIDNTSLVSSEQKQTSFY